MPKINPEILRFDSLDSTNIKAKELLQSGVAQEGTVVLAKSQTQGKGSKGRDWHSPQGGLYFSIIFKAKEAKRVTDYSILAGTAVCQALRNVMPKSIDLSVKWPNDCLVSWKKVSGILSESFEHEGQKFAIVGIGINVNMAEKELEPFQKTVFQATSLQIECAGTQIDSERVLELTLNKLSTLNDLYNDEGFQAIQFLWESNCRFIGKKLELREAGWSEADYLNGKGTMTGFCMGIDQDGSIVLADEKGGRRNFHSGEITRYWE